MIHVDHGLNLFASLAKFCQDRIAEMSAAALATPIFVDFDAHTDLNTLPQQDVLGLRGFTFAFSNQTVNVNVALGVSTFGDTNLFRQRAIVNFLTNRVKPSTSIDVVDAVTGHKLGWMSVGTNVTVSKVAGSTTRPYQQITLPLFTDQTG